MKLFLMGLLMAAGPQWLSSSVASACASIDPGSAIALASGYEVSGHPHPAHGEYVVRKAKHGGKAHAKTFVVRKHDGDGPKVIKKRIKLNKSGKGCDSCKKCKKGCSSAKKKGKGCRCGNSFTVKGDGGEAMIIMELDGDAGDGIKWFGKGHGTKGHSIVKRLHGGKGNVLVFDGDDESGNIKIEVIVDGDDDGDIKWFGKGHGAKGHAMLKKLHGGHGGMFISDDEDDSGNIRIEIIGDGDDDGHIKKWISKGHRAKGHAIAEKLHGGHRGMFISDNGDDSANIKVEVIVDGDDDGDIKWIGKGHGAKGHVIAKRLHAGHGNIFFSGDDDESQEIRVEVIVDGGDDGDMKWFGKGHGAKAHAFAKKMHGGHAGMFFSDDDDEDDDDENVFIFSGNGGGCCDKGGKGHNFAKMFGDGHGLHSVMKKFGHGFGGGNVKFKSLGGDGDAKAFMIMIGGDDEGENVFKFNCKKGGKGCCGKCKKGSRSDVSFGDFGQFFGASDDDGVFEVKTDDGNVVIMKRFSKGGDFDFDFDFDGDTEVDVQGLLRSMGISGGEARVLKSKKCSKCKTGKKAKKSKKGKKFRKSKHSVSIKGLEALEQLEGLEGLEGLVVLKELDGLKEQLKGLHKYMVIDEVDGLENIMELKELKELKGLKDLREFKGKKWHRKGKGSDHWVQISGDDPRDNVMVNAIAFSSNDGRSEPNVRFVTKGDRPKKKRGWLGVSISEVPGALAAQLDIEGKGILIANVVAGSPADSAGITVHDIIISVDGEAIEGNTNQAVKLISMHKPGDEVVIELLRDGEDKTFVVELAARGDVVGEWRVNPTPDAEIEDRINTRARVLRKGPKGIWVVEDLGDLEELEGLPDHIKMLMPHSGSRSMNVFFGDGVKTITTKVEKDGTVLSVEGDSDGEIEVSRVDADGNETEKEYASADELEEADPEAFELWSQIDNSMTFKVDIDGLDLTEIEMPNFSFEFDTEGWKEKSEEWKEHAAKWHEHMGESLAGIGETHELAMKAVHEALEKVREEHGLPEGVTLTNIPHFLFEKDGNAHLQFAHGGKPQHTFEVRADGTIEVRIRKGGNELVRLYEDDDDLAKRSPKLYERYEDLMGIEVEDE